MSDALGRALRQRVLSGDADADEALVFADYCFERDDSHGAAAALDHAFGLRPDDARLAEQRAELLDNLALDEHGLRFRYVPAGSVLLGSEQGDFDERPAHRRSVAAFYLADVPLSWLDFCRLLDWHPPPAGYPKDGTSLDVDDPRYALFCLRQVNKVRRIYCEQQDDRYDRLPVVAVDYPDALAVVDALCRQSSGAATYRLPSEAEWERAARGGLVGARYPWGDASPSPERLDCDNFGAFRIADPRRFAPNGYGLYAMCGTVWEWTSDRYDALAYAQAAGARVAPPPAHEPAPHERVLRGGSWADCAAACTVSFRSSARAGTSWLAGQRDQIDAPAENPNIGMRVLRQAATIDR
ncbi:MAG: SUMF1/EgtB/PvdO family nonheme iron enzyme [Myxococcales bacterium]|nr:SUMF1/EgtB/PvdO family nonheme iron enzyme [Myxococcales bacterium]